MAQDHSLEHCTNYAGLNVSDNVERFGQTEHPLWISRQGTNTALDDPLDLLAEYSA
jgi:hypothetical protein